MARYCVFTEDNPPTASGYIHPATLASGTASASTYLRGDGTWATPASGSLPTGVIVMWSGLLADVPAGWLLCDGTNGTPDLRDRFIRGWTAGVDPGTTGGAATHSHAAGTYAVATASAGTPTGTVAWPAGVPTFVGVATTAVVTHTHGLSFARGATTGGATTQQGFTSSTDTSSTAITNVTDAPAGAVASYTPSGTVAWPAGVPTFTGAALAAHTHTFSGSTDVVNHEPAYYQLAYIMKS